MNENEDLIECPKCGGAGIIPPRSFQQLDDHSLCNVCLGKGMITIERERGSVTKVNYERVSDYD